MSNMYIFTNECIHLHYNQNNFKIPILTNVWAEPGDRQISWPGPTFDIHPGRAGRPGSLVVAGRGSLIPPGVAGRGARVGDPPRPCPPCPLEPCLRAVHKNVLLQVANPHLFAADGRRSPADRKRRWGTVRRPAESPAQVRSCT